MSAGTVLVVDHHREIVSFATIALSNAAYDVFSARSAQDGLDFLEAHGSVDMAISEVMMPGRLSGVEFVHRVQQRFPSTAVMLMTGFTEELIDPGIPLLKKPFAATTLVGQVERVLAESRRRTEDLRESCRKLRSQFEANLGLRPEVEAAVEQARRVRDESRKIRLDWIRSRLRQPDVRIPSVLVVEADALSRSAICHFLESTGLTVLRASNGEVALELIILRRGRIDMLITDVKMSGMSGLELANIVSVQFPRTHIVFGTGEDVLSYQALRKPFEPEDLLAAIAGKLLQRMQERGDADTSTLQ
jgi:DNA-binding NtrC family response regulator